MKINKIANAPLYARNNAGKTSFGSYKLAPQWQPFLNEIQDNAARKCLSNMDGDFFLQLSKDLKNLQEAKINFSEIVNTAKSSIMFNPNYHYKTIDEFNRIVTDLGSKINNPSDVDVLISKPYWGTTRPEITSDSYSASLTDSFIDLIIPGTDYKYSHKLGTQRRFFNFTDTRDDDFLFAHKLWNNLEDNKKSPYKRMFDDFSNALITGFENLYENIFKAQYSAKKGSGKIAPFTGNKQFNDEFIPYYY